MKHGTLHAYNHGCRCEDCRLTASEYHRARRLRVNGPPRYPRKVGRRIALDVASLRGVIRRDGRSLNAIGIDAGLSQGAVNHLIDRGSCSSATFDALCAVLGLHGYEIEVTP